MVPNFSRACSLVAGFNRQCRECIADLHAFHAPSECYRDVSKGLHRSLRKVKQQVRGLTKLRWSAFCREVERRTSPKFAYNFLPPHQPGRV